MSRLMSGSKKTKKSTKNAKIHPLSPNEKERLEIEPLKAIQGIIEAHDKWQLRALSTRVRL
jgi:hypothetical protein